MSHLYSKLVIKKLQMKVSGYFLGKQGALPTDKSKCFIASFQTLPWGGLSITGF